FLDVFKWVFTTFTQAAWAQGLEVVPLLALGNIFLGIYYNLSVWYKLTNKNKYGAIITVAGAIITIVLNVVLIPVLHYTGAALATFGCYLFMMICSYLLGQKYYPVPYPVKKLTAYLVLCVLIYMLHIALTTWVVSALWFSVSTAFVLLLFFTWFVSKTEAAELAKMPVIGRFFIKKNN
ncbi:MAG: polysaccharide biosynthesis protein, partial [Chitinophagaceae bacterium]